jgi:hypothetical protein
MPIILAIWEAEIRKIMVQSQPGHIVHDPEHTQHKEGLAEWLKWQRACLAHVRP